MRYIFLIFSVILIIFLTVQTVSASVPSGGTLTTGTNTTNATPTSSGTSNAAGGYVTELDIYASSQQTTNWQGFWGNVDGGMIYLNDSSRNFMYSWTINEANGGYVYATTKTSSPTWSTVGNIDTATLDGPTLWNMAGKSDSISNTYQNTTNLNISGIPVLGAKNTTVNTYFNNSVISEATSPTQRSQVIWVGAINNDKTNFKQTTSDYELLVPVISGDVYYFYIEIW